MLRLTQEGNIEVADKIYKMKANYKCSNISRRLKASQDSPISVYGDLYEWDNNNLTCFEDMVGLSEDLKYYWKMSWSDLAEDTVRQDMMMRIRILLHYQKSFDRV